MLHKEFFELRHLIPWKTDFYLDFNENKLAKKPRAFDWKLHEVCSVVSNEPQTQ